MGADEAVNSATDEAFVDVFKALADTGRRSLLDALFARDGQRLGELCEVLPAITRFGVMKHLAVLEGAGLVTAYKVGREKRHYLNPVPIQQIHDRWLSKYAQPFVRAMVDMQRDLEAPTGHRAKPNRRNIQTGPTRPGKHTRQEHIA